VCQQDENPTIQRPYSRPARGEAPGDSTFRPTSLESLRQAEDISNLVYGDTSYIYSATRDLLAIFAHLRPKNRPPRLVFRLLGEPPLGQSSPKLELIPDSSRTSMQSFTPLTFSATEKSVMVQTNKKHTCKLRIPTILPYVLYSHTLSPLLLNCNLHLSKPVSHTI